MERGVGSIWCLVLLILGVLPGCWSQGSHSVVIDGYKHNGTITSGDSVPLGTQIILVCQVVGLPYGTPLSYTWTCPNGPCEVKGYYGRKVYNEHILAVNTTFTSDRGTYTCQVTATGGHEATGSFTLRVNGGDVVHSYGRLIPHEFPITDLQQISGPDGIGRITCIVSSGTAGFVVNSGHKLGTGGVSQTRNGATATLVVNPSNVDSFQSRALYCTNYNNFFYLFISSDYPLSVPSLMVDRVKNLAVKYQAQHSLADPLIAGYKVTRFGVPMIGQYVNAGRGRRVTISPAVPGAQYRITAWALGDGRRSATPAVVDVTTGEAGPSSPRSLSITREFQDRIELNWLPPIEPNGEVDYVIYYTPEGGTEQSIDTGSNLSHYNLTGLERNRVYTNITVLAVNSAGSSGRSAVTAQINPTPPDTTSTGSPSQPGPSSTTDDASKKSSAPPASNTTAAIAGVVVAILVVVLLALVGGIVAVVVVVKKRKMNKTGHPHSQAYLQDTIQDEDGHEDQINMYQNVQMKPTPTPGNSEPYYSTVPDKFANPASATASFGANTYDYSDVDHRALDGDEGGLYEDAGVDASRRGGGSKDKPVKGASGVQTASALLAKKGYELMHPEDFYAQPDKTGKVKKDNQGSKIEETSAPVEDLYAMPDMTKKMKQRNQKSLEQESEERKLPPQAPLPYKKHMEAKEEGEEDVPELPPAYDFDGEQDCDTGDGDGSERRFEYAVLDWQKK